MSVPLGWTRREPPLEIGAVWLPGVRGRAADWAEDPRRPRWRGLAVGSDLFLTGPDLPWVDGAVWLGVDDAAPGLWLPVHRAPTVSAPLLLRAVARTVAPPVLVLPGEPLRVLSVGDAAPLDPVRLTAWTGSAP